MLVSGCRGANVWDLEVGICDLQLLDGDHPSEEWPEPDLEVEFAQLHLGIPARLVFEANPHSLGIQSQWKEVADVEQTIETHLETRHLLRQTHGQPTEHCIMKRDCQAAQYDDDP
jgi:hypothetical protein